MQTNNRLFDDLARVAGGAASTLTGVKEEVEGIFRQRLEKLLADMDLVPRDEFDAVKAMAQKARAENDALSARIAALEAQLAEKPKANKKTASTD
ncbi:MAG: accessory factor UbiK family protein [Rhodospirillales bacterium]